MDFQLPDANDPRRVAVRQWLDDHPESDGAGSSPKPGTWHRSGRDRGASMPIPIHQLIIDDELSKAKVRRPVNPIGIGWAGPDAVVRRHRGAEAALPAGDPVGRRVLVPAVQRVGQRKRSRQPRHARRSRRRRVRRQRSEDLDQWRAARGVRDPARPHRSRTSPSTRASRTSSVR